MINLFRIECPIEFHYDSNETLKTLEKVNNRLLSMDS